MKGGEGKGKGERGRGGEGKEGRKGRRWEGRGGWEGIAPPRFRNPKYATVSHSLVKMRRVW